MTNKYFILGSPEPTTGIEELRTCFKCGRLLWFGEKWDWNKAEPVCPECCGQTGDDKKALMLNPKTIQNLKNKGMNKQEIDELSNIIKEETGIENLIKRKKNLLYREE